MAARNVIAWKDTLTRISTDSGFPKKGIEEHLTATANTLETLIKETRPKNVGEETVLKTPLGAIRVKYAEERVVSNPKTGEQFMRPACMGINIAPPEGWMTSANTGISLEKKPIAAGKVEAPKAAAKKSA